MSTIEKKIKGINPPAMIVFDRQLETWELEQLRRLWEELHKGGGGRLEPIEPEGLWTSIKRFFRR